MQLHIQQVGDWTRALSTQLASNSRELVVRINGPIGTSTAHFVRFKAVIFTATGVGVTPFLSTLRHLLHTWRQELHSADGRTGVNTNTSPTKVYFVWSTREVRQLQWVLDTLDEFQDVLSHARYHYRLELHLHLTSPSRANAHSFRVHHHESSSWCVVKLLCARVDWRTLFAHVGQQHRSSSSYPCERIGVFICANRQLTKLVKDEVATFNATRGDNPRLDAFAESFV